MLNPFTYILECWDEEHWIKENVFDKVPNKYCLAAVIWNMAKDSDGSWTQNFELYPIINQVINEQFPDRVNFYGAAVWDFNIHPKTTFNDIQSVLIGCAESWRQRFATPITALN